MIRCNVTFADLKTRIEDLAGTWFDDTSDVVDNLPDPPASSDFKPLWSKIKTIYIDLQQSKCCFCEKPLEGKIEQDVEHFRPKAEVKPWTLAERLEEAGVKLRQPDDGESESGYRYLAYHPFNYAMACKFCNSTLKKNFFPICGTRRSDAKNPARMKQEKALLIYPFGDFDDDPEDLIEFIGPSPVPKKKSGFDQQRTLAVIELFHLDDFIKRPFLFKSRAYLLRLLFKELEGLSDSKSAADQQEHQTAIDNLIGDHAPFTNCLRSFKRLYDSDPATAKEYSKECLKYMKSKSIEDPNDEDDE